MNTIKRFSLAAVAALAIASPVLAKNAELVPAPLETCDGVTWSGLTLGKTTARDVKKQFKAGHSDLPMSQELSQPREAKQKVFALYSDKHDDAPLSLILIRYSDNGPDLTALGKAGGAPEQDYYQTGRLEDWKLAAFPSKGIVAFEVTKYGQETVPMVVLCPPNVVSTVCRDFSTSVESVVERRDPFANEPRVMRFGTASATFNLTRVSIPDSDRKDWENTMRGATAHGTMRYEEGAPGSFVTTVTANWDPNQGGTITVQCDISGPGPYGMVNGSGSSTQNLPKDQGGKGTDIIGSIGYMGALILASNAAQSSFASAMTLSGPPPVESVRALIWQQLIEDFRSQRPALLASDLPTNPVPPAGVLAENDSQGGASPKRLPFHLSPAMEQRLKFARQTGRDAYLKNLDAWVSLMPDQKKQIKSIIGEDAPPTNLRTSQDKVQQIWQTLTPAQQTVITNVGQRPSSFGTKVEDYVQWLKRVLTLTDDQTGTVRAAIQKRNEEWASVSQSGSFQGREAIMKIGQAGLDEKHTIENSLSPAQKRLFDAMEPDALSALAAQARSGS